jgi:hypothetical protein
MTRRRGGEVQSCGVHVRFVVLSCAYCRLFVCFYVGRVKGGDGSPSSSSSSFAVGLHRNFLLGNRHGSYRGIFPRIISRPIRTARRGRKKILRLNKTQIISVLVHLGRSSTSLREHSSLLYERYDTITVRYDRPIDCRTGCTCDGAVWEG